MQRKAVAVPSLVGAILDVVAAVILIPRYGLQGAAIASLLGALGFGLCLCTMVRLHGVAAKTLRAQLSRVAAVILALTLATVATSGVGPIIAFGATLGAAVGTYALCGVGRGVLTSADVERLRSAAPRVAVRTPAIAHGVLPHMLLVARMSS